MMDTYSIFREIADSWVLLAMFLFFVATVLWVFRPGSRDLHRYAAQAPFRNDEPGADMKEARQ
jgi:cytochrome c oxidase cbb3-type subunit 4